jgi:hypothetical protein
MSTFNLKAITSSVVSNATSNALNEQPAKRQKTGSAGLPFGEVIFNELLDIHKLLKPDSAKSDFNIQSIEIEVIEALFSYFLLFLMSLL